MNSIRINSTNSHTRFVYLLPLLCVLIFLLFISSDLLRAQEQIREPFILDSLYFNRINIADTTSPYSLFEQLTNLPHALTKESVLRRGAGLVLGRLDTIQPHNVDEYERYLRELGVFSTIVFELDFGDTATSRPLNRILKTRTEDGWSLVIEPYREPGEDRTAWVLVEANLLGYAKRLGLGADLISPLDSTWRSLLQYRDPALFGTSYLFDGFALWSRGLKRLEVDLRRPFYSDLTPHSWGGEARFADGYELFFRDRTPDPEQFWVADTNYSFRYGLSAWYGNSNRDEDLFHAALAVSYNRHDLESGNAYPRAFDNSVSIFGGIGSLRREYVHLDGYDFSGSRLVPIGAQGRVSIGKFFAHHDGLDDVVYVGGDIRKSMISRSFYSFVKAEAGTGFSGKETLLTMFRGTASGGVKLGPGILAAMGQLSVAWRWPRYLWVSGARGDIGLRGYDDREVFGDNRLGFNVDYRLFPMIDLGLWEVGLAGFWDVAGLWNQAELFGKTRFHNGAGVGIRIGNSKKVDGGVLRVDIGWNFDRGEIGEIDFGIHEAFDLFGTLDFEPPAPYTP